MSLVNLEIIKEMDKIEKTLETKMNYSPDNFPYPFSGSTSYIADSRPPTERLINLFSNINPI
jgi:hypothetical protein